MLNVLTIVLVSLKAYPRWQHMTRHAFRINHASFCTYLSLCYVLFFFLTVHNDSQTIFLFLHCHLFTSLLMRFSRNLHDRFPYDLIQIIHSYHPK